MTAVIFFMEDNDKSMFADIDVWRRTIYAFNIDCYIVVDETENHSFSGWSDQNHECHIVKKLDEALAIHPNLTKVWVDTTVNSTVTVSIEQFSHPKDNVVYIFGPDGRNIELKADHHITLDVPYKLWEIQACSIVLYDRNAKK